MIRRKDQMMFEPAPTGIEHLETMLKAIEEGAPCSSTINRIIAMSQHVLGK